MHAVIPPDLIRDEGVPADHESARFAACGALSLTGLPDGPMVVPAGATATRLDRAASVLAGLTAARGHPVTIDGAMLLSERSAITGFGRRGATSVGGSCHMLEALDGWLALNLSRLDDLDLLPAWLGVRVDPADWRRVAALIAERSVATLVERAALIGLPCSAVPEFESGSRREPEPWSVTRPGGTSAARDPLLVIEMASLWAGPLAGSLLVDAGCRVIKLEHPGRPDGARRGSSDAFDLWNAGKESVACDLRLPRDRALFDALLARVAVVIDGSRPRVATNLGIDAEAAVQDGVVWISITGHGRGDDANRVAFGDDANRVAFGDDANRVAFGDDANRVAFGDDANRVAFGDDAAVAGGLVIEPGVVSAAPLFVADAAADPIAGLLAAVAALQTMAEGTGQFIDLSLRGAAAWARGVPGHHGARTSHEWMGEPAAVEPPAARPSRGRARDMGADTAAIRKERGV